MLLYILRENLDVVGVIDSWSSLLWNTKFQEAGSFELEVSATPRNKRFLQAGRFLARSDIGKIMYINTIEDSTNDSGKTILASGYSMEGIFKKRMYPIWSKNIKHGEVTNTIDQIFKEMTPLGFKMDTTMLDSLYLGGVSTSDLRTDMESYIRFLLLREGDEKEGPFWQKPSTYTMEFDYNYPNKGMVIVRMYLYDYNEAKPSKMYSEDIGNITDITYSYSEEGCYSSVIALINKDASITVQEDTGEKDELGNALYTQINLSWSDLYNTADLFCFKTLSDDYISRNETVIYVDPVVSSFKRTSTSSTKHPEFKPVTQDMIDAGVKFAAEGDKQEYWITEETATTYYQLDQPATMAAMLDAVEEELKMATENIQGTVKPALLSAYNIGDIVVFRDNERMIDFYKRIEEIQESFDSSGYRITPTFGEPLKTIYDLIRK